MKYTLCFILILTIEFATSQTKPNFFPEEVSQQGIGVQCFCKPGTRDKSRAKGIVLSYTSMGKGTFREEDNSIVPPFSKYSSWERWEFGIKLPVVNKERLKALIGFKYESEVFNMNFLGTDFSETFRELDATMLKKGSVGLLLTHPFNETKYLAMRLGYSANGNYSGVINFDNRYSVYKALALLGIKPNEDFEWGIGLSLSSSFRRTTIFPFLVYNRNFNKRWGLESVFPANVYVRYNVKPTTILLLGATYNSESYRLDVTAPNDANFDYGLNHSEVVGMLRLEQQIVPWVWTSVKLGYQNNFSTDFESNASNTIAFKVEPTNGLFFEVGIFASPPDSAMEKKRASRN